MKNSDMSVCFTFILRYTPCLLKQNIFKGGLCTYLFLAKYIDSRTIDICNEISNT